MGHGEADEETAAPPADEAGRTLPASNKRYVNLSLLGTGATGGVFKAWDRDLKRWIAIKALHPAVSRDRELVLRFEDDLLDLARLYHPNIVAIYDFYRTDTFAFFTMELITGTTLEVHVNEGEDDVERMVRLFVQLADALASAHDVGLIHRDVTPRNVMVTDEGQAKLMDFGLVAYGDLSTARPGGVVGTLAYLPPEVVDGHRPDARSDVYQLADCLYKALTGQPMLYARQLAPALHTMTPLIVPPPSELNPAVDPALDEVVLRASAVDPSERYPSAGALRDALRKWLSATEDRQAAPSYDPPAPLETTTDELVETLRQALGRQDWGGLFETLRPYVARLDHDEKLTHRLLTTYSNETKLKPLAKIICDEPDERHILVSTEMEARCGRHEDNTIMLFDTTCRTARFHGRLVNTDGTRWLLEREPDGTTSDCPFLSVNDVCLEGSERVALHDGDTISFSPTVVLRVHLPADEPPSGLRLTIDCLPEDDDDLVGFLDWVLLSGRLLAGGSPECLIHLPGLDGPAFALSSRHGIFWLHPLPTRPVEVTVGGTAVEGPTPLLHRHKITAGPVAARFFQLRTHKELWSYAEELEARRLHT